MAILALFAALSFGIYAAEVFIPNPIPIPGIKLGLSNIIILVVLRRYGVKDASLVLIVRLILSCLLFGSLLSLLYSAVGGVICLLVEALINRILNGRAIFVTAAFGALFHNAGQLAVAIAVTRSPGVLLYAPYLAVAGIITGLITGLCAFFILRKLPKLERTAG
ncbi:MAG: Gx transporter family protein [Lachnospiraceae bacterium]|nr:Gx transporter family protein [Lachnospiraceae bacterium]